jgi:pimeloyl-[acyl-carrier protein] methyl ester esterase
MAYLERDGGQVYYEDHGSGERTVLLLHGWGMSLRVWDAVLLALLKAGYRVVLMDHRGCGGSDKDFADMSIPAIAGDVVALVEALGLERVTLNGWSLGGAVAVDAAGRLGGRCEGLVLTCAASPIYVQKPDLPLGGTAEDMAATVKALEEDRITFLWGLAQAVCALPVDQALEQWMWRVFTEASPRAAATLAELATLDQRQQLASLALPILSFVGGQDAFVAPPICRWVAENNSRASAVEFEQSGHAPFIEERERYLQALLAFLADNDGNA